MVGSPRSLKAPAVPQPPPDVVVPTPDGRIALRMSNGGGTPVLLLHGLGGSNADFAAQVDGALGRRYRLIAPDMPGHGASDTARDPARRYTLPGFADAMVAVLEDLDLDEVVLIGASFGGHVALEMMTCFPGVLGTMLWDTAPLGHGPHAIARTLRPGGSPSRAAPPGPVGGLTHGVWGDVLQAAAGWRDPDGVAAQGSLPAFLLRSLLAGDYADQTALVAALDIPLAMIAGADDPLIDPAYLASIPCANLWGGAYIHSLEAGALPGKQPERPAGPLTRFLVDMDRRRQDRADHPLLSFSW